MPFRLYPAPRLICYLKAQRKGYMRAPWLVRVIPLAVAYMIIPCPFPKDTIHLLHKIVHVDWFFGDLRFVDDALVSPEADAPDRCR